MTRRRRFASLCLVTALCAAGAVRADQAEVDEARVAYQKGNNEYNLGNYADRWRGARRRRGHLLRAQFLEAPSRCFSRA